MTLEFLTVLIENTIYFETINGLNSIVVDYYAKKSFAVEDCKHSYELDIKNDLKYA